MKLLPVFLIFLFGAFACAQDPALAAERLVSEVSPQVVISIAKHTNNADLVEVSVLAPNYPQELLRSQCIKIGQITGDPTRGLQLIQQDLGGNLPPLLKAKFATSGLADYQQGLYAVSPIANAFVGAPSPFTVTGMEIKFLDTIPTSSTLRTFASRHAAISGVYDPQTKVLDYRLRLMSQGAGSVDIPTRFVPAEVAQKPTKNGGSRTNLLLFTLVAVGALAAGVLVYSLILMRDRGATRS